MAPVEPGEAALPGPPPQDVLAGGGSVDALAAATGGLAAAAGLIRFGVTSEGLVALCFLGALGVLAVIDYREHLLPNRIVLPSAAVVLGLQLILFPEHAVEWVGSAVGCGAVLLVPALIRPGALGMGDAKLGLLLGAGLGLEAASAMLLGFVLLWPYALWLVVQEGAQARKQVLPLGPALAAGAVLVTLAG